MEFPCSGEVGKWKQYRESNIKAAAWHTKNNLKEISYLLFIKGVGYLCFRILVNAISITWGTIIRYMSNMHGTHTYLKTALKMAVNLQNKIEVIWKQQIP